VIEFLTFNPVGQVWVEVYRVFLDQDPMEVGTVFIGQIRDVSIAGPAARARCVGFEFWLKKEMPHFRYSPGCNYFLYDDNCKVNQASYAMALSSIAVDGAGLQISHADIGTKSDGYFNKGWLVWGDHKRMIESHAGATITLRYAISGMATGEDVTIYAGCDWSVATCKARFNNVANYGGFPFIPKDNPVMWIDK
jgi:uncharacterized phage protein (TIGR02218 family)